MKIGIFSKFAMAGGSEFRCVELANSVATLTEHDAYLISDRGLPDKISNKLNSDVNVITNVFNSKQEVFYGLDKLIIVNTDSKEFTTIEYWEGKGVDLKRIKQMNFLFNFIVSPARHLDKIQEKCNDVRILTTNKRFFHEITTKEKHINVRHFPRAILRSPIDPKSVFDYKIISDKIRIGKHSKGMNGKWNAQHLELITKVNEKVGEKVIWDFMGMAKDRRAEIHDIPNVILRDEFSIDVADYLSCIDIFLFFNDWKRQEPWARAVGEGMAAGCAVLANKDNAGNEEQILHGNNGFLFSDVDTAVEYIVKLVNNPTLIKTMGRNNLIYSREFSSKNVIEQLLEFLK